MLRRLISLGFVMLVGACRPATPPTDAGVDDSGVDAGSLDAGGSADDAGALDAGPSEVDAGFSLLLPVCGVQQGQTAPGFARLDTGQSQGIRCLQKTASSVVSVDGTGRWVLWRSADGARVASGTTTEVVSSRLGDCESARLSLKGDTLAVIEAGSTRVQVRSATTGLVSATLAMGTGAGVSTDGSAVWVVSAEALEVYSSSGALLFREAGDYSNAGVFAEAGQLRVAHGTTLERFVVPGGARTVLGSFSGSFRGWFHDGSHFFTRLSTTVWIYSADGVQRSVMALPATNGDVLEGQRDWFWQRTPMATPFFRLDAGQTPVTTQPIPFGTFVPAGDSLGVLPHGMASFEVLHLGESSITSTTFSARVPYLSSFAANDQGEWVVGADNSSIWNSHGDGGVTPLGCGAPLSVTGAETGLMAVATGAGQVLLVDLRPDGGHTLRPPIDFYSSHVELSADGRHLAAAGSLNDAQYWNDRSLRVYDTADGGLEHAWSYVWADYPTLFFDFSFAREGTRLSHVVGTYAAQWTYSSLLTDREGTVIATAASTERPMLLSPDGRHAAQSTTNPVASATTTLFADGVLSGAVMGRAIGWLSNDRLLINVYRRSSGVLADVFDHAELRDAQGALVQMSALPELNQVTMVSASTVYDSRSNATYDVTTGRKLWQSLTGALPSPQKAAPAGDFAVFVKGSLVSAEPR